MFGLLCLSVGCDALAPLSQAEATRLMQDRTSPDARRRGIAYLVTHYPAATTRPYTGRYRQIAGSDADWAVRAMAIRALNVCRDPTATPLFVAGLGDDAEEVRLESAKALANVPDPAAIPALLQLLDGRRPTTIDGRPSEVAEDRDVRLAAATALRRYPTIDVEHALVNVLDSPDFGLAWQARQSLVALTGRDLFYDQAGWLKYLVRV